jgi:hypothetical protein
LHLVELLLQVHHPLVVFGLLLLGVLLVLHLLLLKCLLEDTVDFL